MKTAKNEHIKILLSVLFFGGLWGIVEATLGSLLHLPIFDATGVFFCSSTIIVPIAMFLLGSCYKQTGKVRALLYMGIMAASIKAIVCAIFHLSFNPVYYIALESLVMSGAVVLIKPTKLVSWKGFGTFALANTVYSFGAAMMKVGFDITRLGSETGIKYLVITNALAIGYVLVAGVISYFVIKALEKREVKFDINKLVYSPLIVSIIAVAAVAVTVVLR